MAAGLIAGLITFKADGIAFDVKADLKVQPNNTKRTGIAGQSGPLGYKEEAIIPYIAAKFSDRPEISLQVLQSLRNVTVTAELSTGKNYVINNGWHADVSELNTAEGEFDAKFEGLRCTEFVG